MKATFHSTADVAKDAEIGSHTMVWHQAQIREKARIGQHCIIGKNVYIDHHVTLGNNVKVQNNASLYHGLTVEDGVFIGPHACFTNDRFPRAINPDGSLKTRGAEATDWQVSKTLVKYGASIGANSTIIGGIIIGRFALIGAGSVVTKDVPDYGLVYGNPAILRGFVCRCARKLEKKKDDGAQVVLYCAACDFAIEIPSEIYARISEEA